jgi:hypothetical protein
MKPARAVHALWFAGALLSAAPGLAGESTVVQTEAQKTDTLALRHGTTQVQSRIAADFTAFAGSEANAQSLVTGLRSGKPITLTTASPAGSSSTTALTFDPPTRPMGHGNVFISLALARQQLASQGISDPTPQQIQAALTGGTITSGNGATAQSIALEGVLTQRAEGMGWGTIAKAQDVKLGQVISGLKNTNTRIASSASPSAATGAGITTAGGARAQTSTTAVTAGRGNSAEAPGHNRSATAGSGIVTATGSRPAVSVGVGVGASANGGGHGAGIVTGAGNSASVQGGARGALMGKGHAKP